jgi:serine phosphatase RsbU (regulator of sigma subunit)
MTGRPSERLDLGALLAAVEDAPPVAAVDVLAERLADTLGARELSFLIADFSGNALIRLGHAGSVAATRAQGRETADRVPLAGSPHGRALATQAVERATGADGTRLFAPVTNRGDAIGVLELRLDDPPDERMVADVALAAHALAYVVIANRRFTDLFEWGQRSVPLSLAAEVQHRLLPASYTCEAGQFTLAGWLEPAGNVGGDTFDFTLERDALHLSMTDAMGHEVAAALLATILVGALRNARRGGAALDEQAGRANADLADNAAGDAFVTGQVARIDLRSGAATIVNAGHPPPLRLRDGRVEPIPLAADPPFGTDRRQRYRVQPLPLEPGDRLIFFTDGILERNTTSVDIEAMVAGGAGMHPREAVQHLIQAILRATGGALNDDATAMCLDWHGGPVRERTTDSGADRRRAPEVEPS